MTSSEGLDLSTDEFYEALLDDNPQDLYDNAPCGYHSLDAEGRIVEVNDTELRWLGRSREDVPTSLRALVSGRLVALPGATRDLLSAAAVLGPRFFVGGDRHGACHGSMISPRRPSIKPWAEPFKYFGHLQR